MAGIDFTGLPDKMKAYSLREGESLLSTILIDDQEFLNYMDLLVDVVDEQALTQMYIDSVLQPGGKDEFNAKGTAQFKNRIGKVRDCKIDFTLTPKQINAMWKSYLGRINKSKRGDVYDAPLQQYILEKISSKGKEELRLAAMFKGVFNDAKTASNRVFDGILPLLSDAGIIDAKQIFAGAPVTQANAIDQLEGVADKVPSQYVNTDIVALVEPDVAKFYNRDYRATYGTKQDYSGFEHKLLDGTRIEIVPEPGLAGTGAILMTPRNNFVWMTGELNSQDAFIIEKRRRNIDIMADFQAAPDLAIAELVWVNDIALNAGKALRTAAAAE